MIHSEIGGGSADQITVRGHDIAAELMGKRDFVDIVWLMAMGNFPTENQHRMVNVLLLIAADHGLTPSAIATRMTIYSAPEAMQGAIAAGVLSAGSRLLGVSEFMAKVLAGAAANRPAGGWTPESIQARADEVVADARATREVLPGLGHPIHKSGDPRVPRLMEIAAECGFRGLHCELAEAMARSLSQVTGRHIPLNAAGAHGAVIMDMGLSPDFSKGLSIVGRAAGLVAHVMEERTSPIARELWKAADPEIFG